ncbi:MAG: A/G-specific adenine glycosylase [Clostridiales bacterium]|nr:A/G-specific adenine glycosylase [Candidatus Apopatocola equi]
MIDLTAPLLEWYGKNKRALPWRESRDAYRVWVSEIMLQQTRIQAVMGYYERFMTAFPTVEALAAAPEEALLKLWEGLGYYSRARNLHKCAKEVVSRYGGRFPADVKALRALPGIGDYTAGAIASIAFDLPAAAVDGNVLRVHARLTADSTPVSDTSHRKAVARELAELYPAGHCGDFTSALMELGETVCLPGAPRCAACPLQTLCEANARGETELYPVMGEKKPRRIEARNVLLLLRGNRIALRKRPEKGLLAGLWEFPDGEVPENAEFCGEAVHIFTHVEWHMKGYILRDAPEGDYRWFTREERQALTLPTAFRFYTAIADSLGF